MRDLQLKIESEVVDNQGEGVDNDDEHISGDLLSKRTLEQKGWRGGQ